MLGLLVADMRLASNLLAPVMIGLLLMSSGCFGTLGDIGDSIIGEEEELHGIPGGLTLACLRSDKYTKMIIEIDYDSDHEPSDDAMNLLKQRLESVCDKSSGISIVTSSTKFSESNSWSADDVREEGRETREASAQDGSILRWHILYPAGSYEDDGVLGVAVDASTIAIFLDDIEEAAPTFGRPSAEEIEKGVVVHEVGHLLGLVNLVYDSPHNHEDTEHPGHSNNDDSVMYWAVESSSISSFISGTVPNDFDSEDKDDLALMANGDISVNNQLWA